MNEPIDAVYTWVDDADTAWAERARGAREALGRDAGELHTSSMSGSRFRNRDELRYSLRSLERYAPFLRKVFLVTDRQRPPWLADVRSDIEVVDHRDIFPSLDDLPTFNSRAIECHLHRIEGLSERFIYFNDDVLLCRATTPADYFDAAGRPLVYLDRRDVVWDAGDAAFDRPVNSAVRNSSRLLESLGHARIQKRIDHVPYALRRSVMGEIWDRFPEALEASSSHPFRNPRDVKLTSALFQYYLLAQDKAVAIERRSASYVKLTARSFAVLRLLAELALHLWNRSKGVKFLSINDAGNLVESQLVERIVESYLRSTYPRSCRFER